MLIRSTTSRDATGIADIYAQVVRDTAISFETMPPDTAEIARRIKTTSQTHPHLVAEIAEVIAGFAYAGPHRTRNAYRFSADVSVYVARDFQRRGIARALYQQLLDRLATAGFHAAFAGIALPNAASIALHEAMGFSHVGTYREVGFKFGAWHDVGWWQRLL